VRFGGLTALQDVDLVVPNKAKVGLVGPNGAGKSTLFAVLSGLLKPVSGHVELLGRDVTHTSPQERARRGIARSFQQPELFRSLTISEHLVLAHRIRHERSRLWSDLGTGRGWRPPDEQEVTRVARILEVLGLEAAADRETDGLPTGTARLVEVGRALAADPKVLLLDEPSAGLNAYETRELANALERVATNGRIAILLVEHDLDFVMGISSLVYVLDSGRLIASGSPAQVRQDPIVQAAYLGTGTSDVVASHE
jgi:branched-chain amino acid transport system ATP-binding protein